MARTKEEIVMQTRPIHEIAKDIRKDWTNMYFGARPYVDAMDNLMTVNDKFGTESGKSIVLYFLSNAASYRGEVARKCKAELKAMIA